VNDAIVRVSYLELTRPPAPIPAHAGDERISQAKMPSEEYLALYKRVGESVRWDQRLNMSRPDLDRLLQSEVSHVYVLTDSSDQSLGFCEFECVNFPDVELKNFGLVPLARGRGLALWLLLTALHQEWSRYPKRIWLHTDNWDHPAAVHLYEKAGFRPYLVRDEPARDL
jgi:ribosomal protein S18 acetylase RimI-like enzyme